MVIFATLVCAIILGTQVACSPPPPDAQSPLLYCPTELGTTWVYLLDGKDVTIAITDSSTKGDTTTITLKRKEDDGEWTDWQRMVVSPSGVSVSGIGPFTHDPPIEWVRLPSKPGDKWKVETCFRKPRQTDQELKGHLTVVGIETIETPAGKYETIRVRGRGRMLLGLWSEEKWFAPSVGVVKALSHGHVLELKSFSKGN